ncbi:prtrc system protein e [Pedobacter sp. UBA4863]|uniref:prtrc system protein e n=1 Tax=Pedobacter sp. UBA4863 TaxID=1947060 RepID=UPI0025FD1066|nr:prtrc system protein e [Pedobacter sp. UBA4863]
MMNFFQSITALQVKGDWKITIARETPERFIVSILVVNTTLGDSAAKIVPPILLKGTAEELDSAFFEHIGRPLEETDALFTNMEQYLKAREQARLSSKMEKDRKEKQDKSKTDKERKFEEAMKKADELEAEGKHREAWMKVPEVNEYPEQEETIRRRKSELSAKFAPNLFS